MTQADQEITEIDGATSEAARSLPAVQAAEAMVARGEVSVAEVVVQRDKIKQVMESVMVEGVHYGAIPGVAKPTLLKPGAEVLCVTFRLAPSYRSERTFHEDDHLTVVSAAKLTHIPTGMTVAEGEGLCTTREKKYAYRGEGRTCPICGAVGTIKRSKFPPRETDYEGAQRSDAPGWYCHAKAGGCGANFASSDPQIADQNAEKVPNPDLPDSWNTVLKMANKRALIAAILNGTAASDIFTQDVEEFGAQAAAQEERSEATSTSQAATKRGRDLPTTWEEIYAWAEPYGPEIGWKEWVRDAAAHLFATDDATTLNPDQKRTLGQKASGAIIALRDAHDPSVFPPPGREEIQRAWASVLDGAILEGPPWRLSPEETSRPTYWEANGLPEPEPPHAPAADAYTGDALRGTAEDERERDAETEAEAQIEDAVWSEATEAERRADEEIEFGGGYEG